MMDELRRRKFLEPLGAIGIATALPGELQTKTGKALGELKEGYPFFTGVEAAFIEAAVDRLIPHDELGPGALETNKYCAAEYGKNFSALSAEGQEEVFLGLEGGSIKMDELSGTAFFNMLYADTIEGFFADPIYGGNRDKAGWKLVGYPGVAADYGNFIALNR